MNILYKKDDIIIRDTDTLILGADAFIKKQIKKELGKNYPVIDNTFSYSTNTVGETIENYNFNLKYIKDIEAKKVKDLTFDEYYYLAILLKISERPDVLVIDNLFGYLNNTEKNNVINICNKNGITLIVFDNELYYAYMSYEVVVIHERKLAIMGDFKDVVKEEKILKRLGYELPFYVDLSTQLKLYGLVDNICYSYEELEGNLWN